MTERITFYTNPQSRGRIVHWMLEEAGAPYDVRVLRFDRGDHKKPEYLAVNPMGKVPAIVDRGVVISEAAAICAYLADAFPQAKLAPAVDDPARGAYYRWLFFGASCIEYAVLDHSMKRPMPERPGVIGYGSYENVLDTLDHALAKGPWLLGDQFTAADVYVGSQIGWGMMMKSIEPRPTFQAYAGRFSERAAFKRSVAHCDELLKEIQASP
ncbi:MAG: glutathione S-transferase family protein [Polyangiaceae bacterium]|nr:glutathione S-transferase family protein [Polyangiaceae bacterium]